MIVGSTISRPGSHVGCFDPAMVLHRLGEVFGDDSAFDRNDLVQDHYECAALAATELGIPSDRPAIRSAARKVRELSPRDRLRVRVAPGSFVSGTVDRYSITVSFGGEAEFPEPVRSQFVQFLDRLKAGRHASPTGVAVGPLAVADTLLTPGMEVVDYSSGVASYAAGLGLLHA